MTNQQICDRYDNCPNLTLEQLSRETGQTVEALKKILSSPPQAPVQYSRQRYSYAAYR